ncbi:MAG: hypothetical protein KAY66_02370 [Neisseria sp.]|nr:hypothetical protein [Neisseria sp.]
MLWFVWWNVGIGRLKKVSDGLCVPCVRLRFVFNKANRTYVLCGRVIGFWSCVSVLWFVWWNVGTGRLKKVSDGLCVPCVRLRFVFDKANRTYVLCGRVIGFWSCVSVLWFVWWNVGTGRLKKVSDGLAMRTITLCF